MNSSSSAGVYPAPVTAPSPRVVAASLDRLAYAALWAFVFALPWEDAVPVFGGFVVGRWLGLIAFGLVVLRLAVLPLGRRLSEMHYWMLAFAAWSCASVFWSVDWDSTAFRAGTYLQLIVLAWLIWELVSSDKRVMGMLFAFILGTYVCAIATINNLLAGRTSGELDDADLAYKSGRYTMEGLNPNDLGLMLALSIPMTLYLLVRRKDSPLTQVVCWVQFVLALITIVLSGSRGAMLAASAGLLMFPAALFRMNKPQKVVAGLMCAAAAIAAISLVPPDTWGRFLKLGTEVTEGTMTHRTQIWTASMEVFRDHAFFGVGAGAHPAAVVKILARALVTHNTFLSVLVELGVVGELILLGLLATSFHRAARIGGLERILWVVALATWCVGVCGGTWEYRKTTWFLFGLLAAHAFTLRIRSRDAARGAA